MQTCLPDKPEVWRIASIIGCEPDAVIGKLLRVWAWFDSHTEDGNAVGVTYSLVDRVSGVTGFAEAMALCGWLEQKDLVLSLPKFDRHNGKTAKNRALTNERVAKSRAKSNAECNDQSVTKIVTREEKRREEVNTSIDDSFSKFWAAYPVKKGRAVAERAFAKARINGDFDRIMRALKAQVAASKDFQFFPHASTWINGKRWDDEIAGHSSSPGSTLFAGVE